MSSTSRWLTAALILVLLGGLGHWLLRRRESALPRAQPASAERSPINPEDPTPIQETGKASSSRALTPEELAAGEDLRRSPGDRAQIDSAALVGRILDDGGASVSGAELTWTALTDDLCDLKVRLIHEGFERVWNASPSAITAADGSFILQAAPLGASDHPSVVWATHAGHEAARVLLKAGASPWVWPAEFRMTRAACIPVQVVDAEGASVAGADVDESLAFLEYDGNEEHDLEMKARKVFGRRTSSGANGEACGFPAPDMKVWMARKGALRAPALWGEHFEKITLVLRPTFRLSGRISSELSGIDPTGATITTYASGESGGEAGVWLTTRLAVRADGTFGPVECPIVARESLVIGLSGGPYLESRLVRAMPHAGDDVQVSIDAAVGEPLDVSVRGPDGKPVEEAYVKIGMEISSLEAILARAGSTAADGIAHLVCPRDRRFWVEAEHEGFAHTRLDLLTWDPNVRRIDIELARAGSIRGRCLHAGKPVAKFDVLYWTKDVYAADILSFEDAEGRFEIKGLPQSEVTLFAVTAELPQSARWTVRVAAEPREELVIELPDPVTLSGRVVSGIDGSPIAAARVKSYSSQGGQVLTSRGDWKTVQPDGTFELAGVGREGTGYAVEAVGFATGYGVVMPGAPDRMSLGTVVLHPLANLVVRLVGDPSRDYSRYVLWCQLGESRPPTSFDARGEARLEGLRPATYEFDLRLPEGDVMVQNFQIRPGAMEPLTFVVTPGCALIVDFEPHEVRSKIIGGSLAIVQLSRDGREVRRNISIKGSEPRRIERMQVGPATLELRDASGKVLCTASLSIESKAEQSVVLSLTGHERRVRIVNTRGEPLGGTKVELCAAEGESPWRTRLEADAHGELLVGPTTATKLRASLQHASAGRAFGLPIDLTSAREPIELVLDAPRTIEVRLVEGKVPREGVQFYFDHPAISIYLRCFWTTGAGGSSECSGFAEGDYDIVVNAAGYWPTRHHVRIGDETAPVLIQLMGLGTVRFLAKDHYEAPIADVTIDVRSLELDADVADWIAAYLVPAPSSSGTDARGEWTVTGLPEGSYTWRARTSQGEAASGNCRVSARSVTDVPFVVQ